MAISESKQVNIIETENGNRLCQTGNSEIITAVKFTTDNKFIIIGSAEGCIYIWKMPKG